VMRVKKPRFFELALSARFRDSRASRSNHTSYERLKDLSARKSYAQSERTIIRLSGIQLGVPGTRSNGLTQKNS